MKFTIIFILLLFTFPIVKSQSEGLYVTEGGKVGIGIDNPSETFDVLYSTAYGNRHFKTFGAAGVRLQRVGDNSGWAYEYGFLNNDGTDLNGFGGYGNGTEFKYFYIGSYSAPLMSILPDGKVGIGTNTVVANKLDIKGSVTNQVNIRHSGNPDWGLLLTNSDGTYNTGYHFSTSGSNNSAAIINVKNDALHLGTNNLARLSINHNGDVGIGTTTPSTKLEIGGSAHIKLMNSNETQAAWGFHISQADDLSGNIGISGRDLNISAGYNKTITIGLKQFDDHGGKVVFPGGTVCIGTTQAPSDCKLAVKGNVRAQNFWVTNVNSWPDYVFTSDYNLRTLTEVENFINQNKHLPEVPSESQVQEKGISLGEMNAILLQKIEELTLYTIEQEKEIKSVKAENKELNTKLSSIKAQDEKIELLETELDEIKALIKQLDKL